MIRFRRVILLVLIMSLMLEAAAAEDGLALLKVDAFATPSGMGNAYTSISNDVAGPTFNPALSAGMPGFVMHFSHNTHWKNSGVLAAAFVAPVSPRVSVHGMIHYGSVGNIEARSIPSSSPISTFDAFNVSFKGGASYAIHADWTVGGSLGWVIDKISDFRGSAVNADFGIHGKITEKISFGIAGLNLGGDYRLESPGQPSSRDVSLPSSLRSGISYRYSRIVAAIDFVHADDKGHVHAGIEASLHELIALRAGYMSGYDSRNFAAGVSLSKHNLSFDYAFVPYSNELGTSHIFGLSLNL